MAKPPFKFKARTRVGFSDTDAQGIVYYGRYLPYFDLARVEYHRNLGLLGMEIGEEGQEFVMRALAVDYHAPAVFDDLIEVYVRLARIGRTSTTYDLAAYRARDDVRMVTAPVLYDGNRIGELSVAVDDATFAERVARLIAPYVLVGWDTAGEPWSP